MNQEETKEFLADEKSQEVNVTLSQNLTKAYITIAIRLRYEYDEN